MTHVDTLQQAAALAAEARSRAAGKVVCRAAVTPDAVTLTLPTGAALVLPRPQCPTFVLERIGGGDAGAFTFLELQTLAEGV